MSSNSATVAADTVHTADTPRATGLADHAGAAGSAAPQPVLGFYEAAKTYPPQRTPLRQLWGHLRGSRTTEVGGYTALQPASFEILPGQSIGIVGLNGAGKSTLLQLAAGTLTPSSGQVRSRGRIAALLELGCGFNPEATGLENIFLYAATMGLGRTQVSERVDAICAFSGLSSAHLAMPVKTYSSGMQVRLAFSVATCVDPDILIVDEALSVGDGVFAKRSFDRVMQLREQGTALLLCSHTLFHVDLFCERCLWLDQGRVHDFGPTSLVLPRYQEYLDSVQQGAGRASGAIESRAAAAVAGTPMAFGQEGTAGLASGEGSDEEAGAAPEAAASAPASAAPARPELARLLEVRLRMDGVEGTLLHGTSLRSTLELDVHLQSSEEEPHPRVGVCISSDSGKILASSMSDAAATAQRDAQGRARLRMQLPALALNKGRYRVGIYLMSHDGRYVYEWTDPFAHIELQHDGIHQGPWLMPAQWQPLA